MSQEQRVQSPNSNHWLETHLSIQESVGAMLEAEAQEVSLDTQLIMSMIAGLTNAVAVLSDEVAQSRHQRRILPSGALYCTGCGWSSYEDDPDWSHDYWDQHTDHVGSE